MKISKQVISTIDNNKVSVPGQHTFQLPERVLQFGTGVLLRGLPDYFIDKANKQGIFNGRVVIIKSTESGDMTAFDEQDSLYTICIRGFEEGKLIEENIISSSISRVISAKKNWYEILQCASNPDLQIIISNTTEIGIQFLKEDIHQEPPVSFPGKLLSFLYERYKAFDGINGSGMIIVPTELIIDNGKKLESILLQLAHENDLEETFVKWLKEENHFCNSLVDRIVPGKPADNKLEQMETELGYKDDLLIIAEPYCLWAIEGNEQVKNILSFAMSDERVIITEDINSYRELKLRLLNGTHIMSCGLAHLAGFINVTEALEDKIFSSFVTDIMLSEIASSIPLDIPESEIKKFGLQVLDRFRNPFIQHPWLNITLNFTSKIRSRMIAILLQYFKNYNNVPANIALGFAGYVLFMKAIKQEDDKYFGKSNNEFYFINDDQAAYFFGLWKDETTETLVRKAMQNKDIWGEDLSLLPGFPDAVIDSLNVLVKYGALAAISKVATKEMTNLFNEQ